MFSPFAAPILRRSAQGFDLGIECIEIRARTRER